MTTYKINIENTGLDNEDQVRRMVAIAQERGYEVEYTRDGGAVQGYDDIGDAITCPIPEQEWMQLLEEVSE